MTPDAPPSFRWKPRGHLDDPDRKRALNRALFSLIAPEYDRVTRRLSFGRDAAWKDRLVAGLPGWSAPCCLDLACGTGDLAERIARRYPRGRVVGLDLTPGMVAIARARVRLPNVAFDVADMVSTGWPDASADLVTGGYALRNAPDLAAVIREVRRVLRPGGLAVFLDFSKPAFLPARWGQWLLLKAWGGFWGLRLHGKPAVYGYLADSLARFPDRTALPAWFLRAGFADRGATDVMGGMIRISRFERKEAVPGAEP